MDTEGIILFRDNFEVIRGCLSFEQKGIMVEALFDGGYTGDDPLVKMAFAIFFAAIQRSNERYKEKCETNRQNALKKWQKEQEIQEKAKAYDAIQLDATASDRIQLDTSRTQSDTPAGTGANTHAPSSSLSAAKVRTALREKGATLTEIEDAFTRCQGVDVKNPISYYWTVIQNKRKKPKTPLAQDFPQRDYDNVDQELMEQTAAEVEAFLAAQKEASAG